MKELTSDENAAVEKIAEQLAAIVGAEASAVTESLHNIINGVEPSQSKEVSDDLYVDPEDTPYFFSKTEKYDPDQIANPEWPDPGRLHVHEWRDYIPEGLREVWGSLSQETKEVAHYMAKEQADQEIWD
jgi:hypothetical protein